MRVTFIPPIDYCIGKVSIKSEFYFRRNKYGKVFVQRCPRRLSEKQKAWNKQFARLYAGRHHYPGNMRHRCALTTHKVVYRETTKQITKNNV